eukprot:GHVS01100624.1.p1 GENE.GHVS01100624.1~~GHVS01100624.1.p1  ORF type:complete len:596 (+),score=43.42 GHVS01100624.1:387-2174(+)
MMSFRQFLLPVVVLSAVVLLDAADPVEAEGGKRILPLISLSLGESEDVNGPTYENSGSKFKKIRLETPWDIKGLPVVKHLLLKKSEEKREFNYEDRASAVMIRELVPGHCVKGLKPTAQRGTVEVEDGQNVYIEGLKKFVLLPFAVIEMKEMEVKDLKKPELPSVNNWAVVMPFLETSQSLDTVLRMTRHRYTISRVEMVEIARQLIAPLMWMHEKGLVHRDVKASNYLVIQDPSNVSDVKEPPAKKRRTGPAAEQECTQPANKSQRIVMHQGIQLILIDFDSTFIEGEPSNLYKRTHCIAAPPESESNEKIDAFSVAQILYDMEFNAGNSNDDKRVDVYRKGIEMFWSRSADGYRRDVLTLFQFWGFSTIGVFSTAVKFARRKPVLDVEERLAAIRLLFFCYGTSIPVQSQRFTVKEALPYLELGETELKRHIVSESQVVDRLWETSRLVSKMPNSLAKKFELFKSCNLDFWVDSLNCIIHKLLEKCKNSKRLEGSKEFVLHAMNHMNGIKMNHIFYKALNKIGKEEGKYKTTLEQAFAMQFLYGWWKAETEVVVSAGAKVYLEGKLKSLESHDDYGKLQRFKIIERDKENDDP